MNINLPFPRIASGTDQFEALRRLTHGDPTVRFEDMIGRAAISMEERSDLELIAQARTHSDPARREHALYQYLERNSALALPEMRRALP